MNAANKKPQQLITSEEVKSYLRFDNIGPWVSASIPRLYVDQCFNFLYTQGIPAQHIKVIGSDERRDLTFITYLKRAQ